MRLLSSGRAGRFKSRCYAVNTWDPAAAGGESAFDDLTRFHDQRYGAFSTLVRSSFDEALCRFADRSVDLLHIDGLPGYEVVRHNFDSWKQKLSEQAVVLIHNINSGAGDTGVWRLWSELLQYAPNFEFLHGSGLGVLAVGENVHPAIRALCSLSGSTSAAALRSRFSAMGRQWRSETAEITLAYDLDQRIAAAVGDAERAQAEARAWEAHAKEEGRARRQIALRIDAARRDVYKANLLAEQSEDAAHVAVHREEQARTELGHVAQQLDQVRRQLEQVGRQVEQLTRERDLLLSSTVWRATWPLRWVARYIPTKLRQLHRRRQ